MLVLKLRYSKPSSYTGSPSLSPSLVVEEAPISKYLHHLDRINVFVMDLEENEARNSRAGEGQQQFNRPTGQLSSVQWLAVREKKSWALAVRQWNFRAARG
jgi:hypothetical protein